jgi:hypothetical protein
MLERLAGAMSQRMRPKQEMRLVVGSGWRRECHASNETLNFRGTCCTKQIDSSEELACRNIKFWPASYRELCVKMSQCEWSSWKKNRGLQGRRRVAQGNEPSCSVTEQMGARANLLTSPLVLECMHVRRQNHMPLLPQPNDPYATA